MANLRKPPCYNDGKDCPKRNQWCHSTCDEYKEWHRKIKAIKQTVWENASGPREAAQRTIDNCIAQKRRKGKGT